MPERYLDYDKNDMFEVLLNTHRQIIHTQELSKELNEIKFENRIDEILIAGMGGSAIGGDLLRSYLSAEGIAGKLRISVIRGYNIPDYVNDNTLVIASSYSGNTEETLSALNQAMQKTENIIALTSGGQLEKIAVENNYTLVKMPTGFQPRCALSYSFFSLLNILMKSGLTDRDESNLISQSISGTYELIEKKSEELSKKSTDNPAYEIALKIKDKVPVIYSSCERLDVVNLRWRGQFHENSKSLAFGNFLPEMNHNEINSWAMPEEMMNKFIIILLRDKNDNSRIKIRFDALTEILGKSGLDIITLEGAGSSLLERIFDLVYLGDWVSYYLAKLYGQDPMAIPVILKLKEILSK